MEPRRGQSPSLLAWRLAPPPPNPRNGHEAGGAGFHRAIAPNGDSTAPFAPESQFAITALHGLRGVGKTTLAAAYADYKATWWIRAQETSTMQADLVALGVRQGWISVDDKEDMAVESMMERLRDEGEAFCSSSTMPWTRRRSEVAPLSWTPHCLGFWSPQWQRSTHLTRRNSAGR